MSLRDALQARVACCAPQGMQHATSTPERATEDATNVQQPSCTGRQFHPETEAPKLHELRELHGPSTYEGPQETQEAGAKVARCTHQGMQHATTAPAYATADATAVQQGSCTPVATPPRMRPRSCTACRHLTRVKTCTEPIAAGLLPTFGIVWPTSSHGVVCPAWRRSPTDAIVAVLTAAGRGGWSDKLMHQWLADADAHPEAVLEALRAGGPTP